MKNKERRKLIRLFSGIIVAIFIATIISICIGKYSIALTDIWNIICGNENVSLLSRKVFFTLRLPRTFMAIMAGLLVYVDMPEVYIRLFSKIHWPHQIL